MNWKERYSAEKPVDLNEERQKRGLPVSETIKTNKFKEFLKFVGLTSKYPYDS